ncbi:RNA polymerase sigma factor [Lewinella sp. 4G2]|uniref:RNA polymerase sigma factor n=1 Tax=Lewinella sp. 4G2 TaxID=1803372 RepID=UPI0007B4EEAC|nr:RNA polymerase sigma factor [Lewinella sp. 4G2]OAV45169.1 hypothetical protein A3850_012000 [Lewinella sp. 4G2]
MTDRQLLIAASQGDQAAFTDLYRRYGARLYAYFLPRAGSDAARAEDLRQQVFLRLLESRAFREARDNAVSAPDDLGPLLFHIAANLLKNEYRGTERRLRRQGEFAARQPLFEQRDSEPDKQALQRAISQLPEPQRLCVDLRFRQNYSIEEIADALDCAPGTVKSRLHYGLKKLAAILRPTTTNK